MIDDNPNRAGFAARKDETLTPAQSYDQYLGPAMFQPWARVLLAIAAPKPGQRVLDLACGTGIVTRQLAQSVGDSGEIVGLDVSEDMLDVARKSPGTDGGPIHWVRGDACAIDADYGYFDLVVCQQGFQFFPDKAAAAREMLRVLDDTGRVVVAVWKGLDHHPVFRALFEAEAGHLDVPVNELAVPFSLGDPAALQQIFSSAGFARVEVTEHSLEARFSQAERFIELIVLAGAAVIPELDLSSPEEHEALLDTVKREARTVIDRHHDGETLRFPMHTNVVVASAQG